MAMSNAMKMRLMLLLGVVMIALTVVVVLYGFKRTEELRSDAHVQDLMQQPKTAAFEDVPVALKVMGTKDARPVEVSALFEDGLLVRLARVDKTANGEPVAVLRLTGGTIRGSEPIDVRLSYAASQWADQGYSFTLRQVEDDFAVFSVVKLGSL